MRTHGSLPGDVVQFDQPVWGPLTTLLGEPLAEWFMWMHEVRLNDGTTIHAYKHIVTRRYLHLSAEPKAFTYLNGGTYLPTPLTIAVQRLLPDRDRIARLQGLDPEHVAALLDAARRLAGDGVRELS